MKQDELPHCIEISSKEGCNDRKLCEIIHKCIEIKRISIEAIFTDF